MIWPGYDPVQVSGLARIRPRDVADLHTRDAPNLETEAETKIVPPARESNPLPIGSTIGAEFPIQKAENAWKRAIFVVPYLGNRLELGAKWAHFRTRITRATTYNQTKKNKNFDLPPPPPTPLKVFINKWNPNFPYKKEACNDFWPLDSYSKLNSFIKLGFENE